MAIRLARTNAEAHLYMELNQCENCGEREFEPSSSVIFVDGDLASRYTGNCPRCGIYREFVFRIPEEIMLPDPDEPSFGDDQPSQLIDAGEWMWVADWIGRNAPAEPEDGMTPDDRREARIALLTAGAAVGEAAKFVPPGADAVPAEAMWSARGRAVYEGEPGRFSVRRLTIVQSTYRRLAEGFVSA